MRINKGQEFVTGGFMPGPHGLDSIIFVSLLAENNISPGERAAMVSESSAGKNRERLVKEASVDTRR